MTVTLVMYFFSSGRLVIAFLEAFMYIGCRESNASWLFSWKLQQGVCRGLQRQKHQ